MRFLLILLCLFASYTAYAVDEDEGVYGSEFTLTSRRMLLWSVKNAILKPFRGDQGVLESKSKENAKVLHEMLDRVKRFCPDCVITFYTDKEPATVFRVTYPDGWYFEGSFDPGVIEIKTKPSTIRELKARAERIQRDIFENAKLSGLYVSKKWVGGHVTFDVRAMFGGDELLERNYIVDFENHPELSMGILGKDYYNAMPRAKFPEDQRQAVAKFIDTFDRSHAKFYAGLDALISKGDLANIERYVDSQHPMSIGSLKRAIQKVYYNWMYKIDFLGMMTKKKYVALRLDEFVDEHRGIRPQQNIYEFIDECTLFQARRDYLRKLRPLIPFRNEPVSGVPAREAMEGYYSYVKQTGLDWDKYRTLAPEEYRELATEPLRIQSVNTYTDPEHFTAAGRDRVYEKLHELLLKNPSQSLHSKILPTLLMNPENATRFKNDFIKLYGALPTVAPKAPMSLSDSSILEFKRDPSVLTPAFVEMLDESFDEITFSFEHGTPELRNAMAMLFVSIIESPGVEFKPAWTETVKKIFLSGFSGSDVQLRERSVSGLILMVANLNVHDAAVLSAIAASFTDPAKLVGYTAEFFYGLSVKRDPELLNAFDVPRKIRLRYQGLYCPSRLQKILRTLYLD